MPKPNITEDILVPISSPRPRTMIAANRPRHGRPVIAVRCFTVDYAALGKRFYGSLIAVTGDIREGPSRLCDRRTEPPRLTAVRCRRIRLLLWNIIDRIVPRNRRKR